MNCETVRERLDDYVDGLLRDPEADPVRRHLEACRGCRDEEQEIRALLGRAAALPADETPRRDLWPAIEDRIRRRNIVHGPFGGRSDEPWRGWRPYAAAAAAIFVVVSVAAVSYMAGLHGAGGIVSESQRSVIVLEAPFSEAREALRAMLAQRRDSLAPDTLAMIDENLRIIDRSLREIRSALEKDPTNSELKQLLVATHRREIDMLQRVNGWSTRM